MHVVMMHAMSALPIFQYMHVREALAVSFISNIANPYSH